MSMIPYARQYIDKEDREIVSEVLNSDYLTTGPWVERFEDALCSYTGAQFSVALSSATAALHIACLSLGLGKDDVLWTTPNTFVASANCGLYCGATVDFVDIDPVTYNMSTQALADKLAIAKAKRCLPKVLVVVDFAGQSCDLKAIKALAIEYDFKIIEDASHAIGGKYNSKPIGCCEFADITVFSFHPVKIITTGEGGALLTNSKEIYEKAKLLRTHGITRDPDKFILDNHGPWYYEQIDLGFNYRITDIQCALGYNQLKKIDSFVERRQELASRYDLHLRDLPIVLPFRYERQLSSLHLYPILIEEHNGQVNRKQVFIELKKRQIGVNVHYIPVHLQPVYRKMGFRESDFPLSLQYYNKTISLPMYYSLTNEQQDHVVNSLYEVLFSK